MDFSKSFLMRKIAQHPRSKKLGHLGSTYLSRKVSLRGFISGIYLGNNVVVEDHATLFCDTENARIVVGDNTFIGQFSILSAHGGKIEIGQNCSVNSFCALCGIGGLTVGNHVRIATHTVIVPANHIFDDPGTLIKLQGISKKG